MNTQTYSMTAPEVADHLGVTARTIRHWQESGDLPKLEQRGQYDLAFATWLYVGRKVSADWRGKTSAQIAVAAGWVQALGREPKEADLDAFGDLFKRNGLSVASAMQALGGAQARLGGA